MSESKVVAPFEVLGSALAPVPGAPSLSQGFFLQVTNLDSKAAKLDLLYDSTPAFLNAVGPVSLLCDIITGNGAPPSLPQITATTLDFLTGNVGFKAQSIPPKTTWLFGVQYFFAPAMPPMTSVEARGYVTIKANKGTHLLLLATTRQVFYNYTGMVLSSVSEAAYAVPTVGGPEVKF